jgi:iron complex outermembrane receptor protein
VNGVINIITRPAAETQGGFAEVGGGAGLGSFGGLRFGGTIGQATDARVYVKYFDHDPTEALNGQDAYDGWQMAQGGFNLGLDVTDRDRVTLRGDAYTGEESALLRSEFTLGTLPDFDVPGTVDVSGYNLLGRWRRQIGEESSLRLQAYYDHTERDIPGSFDEDRDTFDVDFQHDLAPIGRHTFAWGTALRVTSDEIGNTLFATFDPAHRSDRTISAFVQDRVSFAAERALLTVGAKLEDNDYTGFEIQPSLRFTWLTDERSTFWAGISRAVRTPARLNTDIRLTAPIEGAGTPIPFYVTVAGDPNYRTEELLAYEAGYRIQIGERLSLDVAVFNNYYDHLQTQEAGEIFVEMASLPYTVLPVSLGNGMKGETYGGTFVANWQPLDRWRLRFQYSRIEFDLELKPGSADVNSLNLAGNSPRHQFAMYSFVELPHGLSLYTGARFVDDLRSQGIEDYLAVDLNLAWQVSDVFRVSLTLQNANDRRHREFGDGTFLERRGYLKMAWTF